jgi:hypothetical protein
LVRNFAHHIFLIPQFDIRNFLIVVSVVIVTLIADTSLSSVADIITSDLATIGGITVFIAIAAIYAVGQYFILEFVKRKNKDSFARSQHLNTINKMVTIVHYILIGIIGFVVLQIVFMSRYYTIMPILGVTISYALGSCMMSVLSLRFLSWYRSKKNLITLLYGLASAMIAIAFALTLVFFDASILNMPGERNSESQVVFEFFEPSSTLGMLQLSFSTLNIANFLLLWVATLLLLHHYSRRLGSIKLWSVLIIPLASYLSIFFILTPNVGMLAPPDASMVYVIIFGYTLPGLASGILFGVPFWLIGGAINHREFREYMIISASGLVLLAVSSSASMAHAPYPPLGLASVLFVGPSSYLVLAGLYSSVISISEDTKLRKIIRRTAIEETKLLDSIGMAQLEKEVSKKVITIAKEHADEITNTSGVSLPVSENEMNDYLDIVMEEVNKIKFKSEAAKRRSRKMINDNGAE